MRQGFFVKGFLGYLRYQFPTVFTNSFVRDLVDNLIEYAFTHKRVSKDQFCDFLSDLLPEVEFGEVAAFMDDASLTRNGIERKKEAMAENKIKITNNGGIFSVWVDGEELYL